MSVEVGSPSGFVDTQDVVLDNLTDAKIYRQAQTVLPFEVGHSMSEHHTCTGFVEKLPSLDNVSLDITAILTEPELPALMTLSLVSSSKLPIKQWRVTYTSFSNLGAAVTGFAKMFNFNIYFF